MESPFKHEEDLIPNPFFNPEDYNYLIHLEFLFLNKELKKDEVSQ